MDQNMPSQPAPINPSPAESKPSGEGFFDKRTVEIIKWSIIGYAAYEILPLIASYLFFGALWRLNLGGHIVSSILSIIIGGAISGLIIAKAWKFVMMINHKVFKGWFNNMFRLIFWPSVVGAALSVLGMFGLFSFGGTLSLYWLVYLAAVVAGSYIYAKVMQSKVGPLVSFSEQ